MGLHVRKRGRGDRRGKREEREGRKEREVGGLLNV